MLVKTLSKSAAALEKTLCKRAAALKDLAAATRALADAMDLFDTYLKNKTKSKCKKTQLAAALEPMLVKTSKNAAALEPMLVKTLSKSAAALKDLAAATRALADAMDLFETYLKNKTKTKCKKTQLVVVPSEAAAAAAVAAERVKAYKRKNAASAVDVTRKPSMIDTRAANAAAKRAAAKAVVVPPKRRRLRVDPVVAAKAARARVTATMTSRRAANVKCEEAKPASKGKGKCVAAANAAAARVGARIDAALAAAAETNAADDVVVVPARRLPHAKRIRAARVARQAAALQCPRFETTLRSS